MNGPTTNRSTLQFGRCPCCSQPVSEEKFEEIKREMVAVDTSRRRLQAKLERLSEEMQGLHLKLQERKGRPPKQATVGERISLGLKVTGAIKTRLDQAARQTGRTQSQEAEVRIERSFDRQDLLGEVLRLRFGNNIAGMLMLLGYAMDIASRHGEILDRGYDWAHHRHAFEDAIGAALAVLHAVDPGTKAAPRKRKNNPTNVRTARYLIASLREKSSNPGPLSQNDFDELRYLLGPVIKRMSIPKWRQAHEPLEITQIKNKRETATAAADSIVALINAAPHTPPRQALIDMIEKHL